MELIFCLAILVASFFFDDDCHHHHCGNSWGQNYSMGWMIAIPLLLVGAVLIYGYHSAYQDSGPKRVFISDVDGSKGSVAKSNPVAQKAVAKAHSSHKTAQKPHSTTHHQLAHQAK